MDKNFVARIMANISNFQKNIKKVQQEAKTAIPDEISTDVTANISKFQRALNKAKAMAQKWREHNVDIDGNTTPLTRAVDAVKAKMQSWREHTVNLKGDDSQLNRTILLVKAKLATIRDKHIKLSFKTEGLTGLQIASKLYDETMKTFNEKIDTFSKRVRNLGTVFQQTFKGLIVASIQAVIPIIASLVPAIMAVANALGVVAGGAVGMAGAIAIGFGGVAGFALMATSALKMLKDGTLQATNETRKYQAALDGVKAKWEGIIKQNQAQIFNTMANALNTVKVALTQLTPFLSGVAKGMERASQSVLKWAQNSQTSSRFFHMMNTTGVKTFNTLLSAAGHFGDGLVNVFTQLAPLFLWSAQQMNKLGAAFQRWANSAAGQNSIKQFMEYVKTNLPKIGQIFANVFAGIGNLMAAFGQSSSGIFDWLVKLTAQFRQWSETVGKSEGFKNFIKYIQENGPVIGQLIGNIVRAIIAFATAMAPIASVVLRVVTAIAGFVAKLFETHPAVARLVGIGVMLAGVLWSLSVPIMLVSSILSKFSLSFLSVIGNVMRFISSTGILRGILTALQTAFRLLMNPVATLGRLLPLLGTAFEILTGPIGIIIGVILALVGIIIYLWKTNEGFRNMIINAWNGIVAAITGAVTSIINWFTQLWNSIMTTLQPIMPLLQMLGQIFMQVLGVVVIGIIQALMLTFQALWTAVSVIFTAIGAIIQVVVTLIVGIFTAFIQFITGDFHGAWLTMQNTVSNVMSIIWQAILSIWGQISNFIFSVLNRILGTHITKWSQIWSAVSGAVTRIWNSISSWFGRMVHTVGEKMNNAWIIIKTRALLWVVAIVSTMVRFVQRIVIGFHNAVSNVRSGMQNAVSAVKSFVGRFISAGLDMMRGLVNGIKQGISWVVSAAKNAASSALHAAKSVLGIHSPSREFMSVGMFTMKGFAIGIDQHVGSAVSSVKSASQKVMDAFQPDLHTNLSADLTDGMSDSLNANADAHLTKDVRHSMQENNRPVVNVTVRNESDIPAIKSYIEDNNSKDASFGLF